MKSDMYLENNVGRGFVGVIGADNESSLFSSSLSDLVNHKLRLSGNTFLSQSSTGASQNNEVAPFKPQYETEGEEINNLLPDEDELFSGIIDGMGHVDDSEEFDVFAYSGGIELESDNHPVPSVDSSRLSNGVVSENSRFYNGVQSPVRIPYICNGFPNSHPRSPQDAVNIIPHNSVDRMVGVADDVRPAPPRKINFETRHMSFNGHGMGLNEGAFGYSPNNTHVHQFVASKSNSYQPHHHLRSYLMPNSPSFSNNNHAHHLRTLPGSPGAPHHMVNMVSPVHHVQVGSAPVIKSSIWDRRQIFRGESHEANSYHIGAVRGMGIRGISTSLLHREISFPCGGVHSPQQRSHMFHERNAINCLASSYSSASERVRSRRNETQLSHADRKRYELNIDRILRGEDSRTTLMIKNIPNKYTSKMLLATIDEHHQGTYDFIYLPIDFKNKCNMGYAFINMIDPLQIVAFHQTFEGRKWEKFNSEKVATLAYARIQGKAALVAHFQNSSLMNEDKRCRPILFHTNGPNAGDQEPFPRGTNCRPKPGGFQVHGDEEDASERTSHPKP